MEICAVGGFALDNFDYICYTFVKITFDERGGRMTRISKKLAVCLVFAALAALAGCAHLGYQSAPEQRESSLIPPEISSSQEEQKIVTMPPTPDLRGLLEKQLEER